MSDRRWIKPNVGHSEAASSIFAVMEVRRAVKMAELCLYVWAAGIKMANGIIVISFNPCTRKIAVDGIRRQDAPSIASSLIVVPARTVTNRTISQTPPPGLSFDKGPVNEDDLLSSNFLY